MGRIFVSFFSLFSCSRKLSCLCFFFLHLIDCGFFKSFLNLIGVDRFFVLIFRFVLQFFCDFSVAFFFFITFFHFFHFWDCRICCDHLNVWGFFVFNIVFLLLSTSLSFFQVFFLLFCFNFYVKEDNMFYIHFQRGSLQQWIRAKGSSKSFLTKAPTPPWHHWEQSTLFSIFLAFFIYLCIYMFIHILKLHFLPFYIGLLFFWVFIFFFLACFLIEIMNQIKLKNKAWKKNA